MRVREETYSMPTEPTQAAGARPYLLWLIPLIGFLASCAAYQFMHGRERTLHLQRIEHANRLLAEQVHSLLNRHMDELATIDAMTESVVGNGQADDWARFIGTMRQRHGKALLAMAVYRNQRRLAQAGTFAPPLGRHPCRTSHPLSLVQDPHGRWLFRHSRQPRDYCLVSDWSPHDMLYLGLAPELLGRFHIRLSAQWQGREVPIYDSTGGALPNTDWQARQQFVLADIPFTLVATPSKAWLAQNTNHSALLAAGLGFGLTLLISLLLYARQRMLNQLDRMIHAQTQTLEQQHLELASVIDHAHDAVLLTGEDGMVLRANPAADALFGYRGTQWHELSIHDLLTDASWLQFHAWSHDEHATMPKRLYIRTADGRTVPCESNIGCFLSHGRKRFSLTLRDITERIIHDWMNRTQLQLRKISQQPSPLHERAREMLEVLFNEPWGLLHDSAALFMRNEDGTFTLVTSFGPQTHPQTLHPEQCAACEHPHQVPANADIHLMAQADQQHLMCMRIRHKYEEVGILHLTLRSAQLPASFLDFVDHLEEILALMITSYRIEENLTHLSYYDALTGLPNRRLFLDRLNHAIAMAKREKSVLSVMFLDLDRFKAVNDTLGHDAGDAVLREAARRFNQVLRESDTAARLGGDEFAILLPKTNTEMAASVARKLLFSLQEPFRLQQHSVSIGTSIGIASYPEEGQDAETLLKHADTAMYHAKKNHAHIHHFSGEMESRAQRILALEQDLSQIVDRGVLKQHYLSQAGAMLHGERDEHVFPVYFQSKHRLSDGAICGFESLLRWNHPVLGLVQPGEFIHLAEESGYIRAITNWVIFKACMQAEQWEREGLRAGPIAVNISAVQLMHEDMAREIIKIVRRAGARPEWLEIEITETAAMHDPEIAVRLMGELVQAGIAISLDDFGTGYSSLAYLKRFPANTLKIDRTFIQGLPDDADDRAIVRSTIAMAHSLEMKVVAEGVEHEDQYRFLREVGCDEVQGYLFNQPMQAEDMTAFLRRRGAKNTRPGS